MAKLNIDLSGRAGLAPRFWGDVDRTTAVPSIRNIGKPGQMADGIWNPFRRYGYLSAANATTQAVTADASYDNVLSTSIYDDQNDDFYFGARGPKLFKGDTLDDTALTNVLDLGSSGTPRILDLEIYQVNAARKMFVVYETGDAVEIAISDLPYDTATDNLTWLTGTVAGTAGSYPLSASTIQGEAFLEVADNGYAYLFMENKVHRIDGTSNGGSNGTIKNNVILFPKDFRIIDAVDYKGLMFMAIHQFPLATRDSLEATSVYTQKMGVYVWDRQSTVVNTRDYIPIQGCKEIRKIYVAPNGSVRVFAINSENVGTILEYTGSTFRPIVETGILSFPRFRDSLTTVSGSTIWFAQQGDNAALDGIVFAHGKITPDDQEAIYKIGIIEDFVTPGAILFGGASTDSTTSGLKRHKTGLYIAHVGAGPAVLLKELDIYGTGGDGVSALSYSGGVSTLSNPLPALSTVNYIDIHMMSNVTGSSTTIGTIVIYFNSRSTPWATKTVTLQDSVNGHYRIEVNKPYVNQVQLQINFGTTIEPGQPEFCPFMAVVDYTPGGSVSGTATKA